MFKVGSFITPDDVYVIYEVVEPGFYRIDITMPDALFNLDVDKVLYSQVSKKKTYVIGDSEIYDNYNSVKARIENAKMSSTKESTWENGVYVTTVTSSNDKLDYFTQTILHNGIMHSYTLSDGEYTITSEVSDEVYSIRMEPLNFSAYQPITIMHDTIDTTETGALYYSIDYLKRRFDLSHIESKDFAVVTTVEEARKRLEQFDNDPYPLRGFDTETTGVDVDIYGEDKLVGVILASNPNNSTYFPFRHVGDWNLPLDFLSELVDHILAKQDRLVAHNKKFDRKVMMKEGFDIRCKWDTMQISIILNPVISKGAHALKTLIHQLNGKRFLELSDIFINEKDIDFSVLDPEIAKYYACPDASNCLDLIADQFSKLSSSLNKLVLLECDLADVKADMEFYGIRVDIKKYESEYKNCNYVIDLLIKAFRTLTQEDGNINSDQVISNLLYNKMHCPVLLRTSTGQPSTSASAIKKLARERTNTPRNITEDLVDLNGNVVIKASELANSKYPALVILAKYREYNKLKTAFYARFERTMKTGRVFFWVNQNGAATGRQSSPMHQLPPSLKEVILSDAPDRDFWGPDFSQIELRMIAYLAGQKDLIELAKDPNNDIHRIIGSLISGKEMWAITKEERSTGKRRNFGVVYLISAFGLAGQIFGPGYTKENVEFCKKQLDDFYHKFKRIDRFIKHNGELVLKQGYMETAWYHRRRLFPQVFDVGLEQREKASIIRMANNVPVQGTAADYLKLAEVQMYNYIRDKGWNELKDGFPRVRMMLSIHDEIIISADQTIPFEEIIEMITKCMETKVEGAPPFFVQPARMDNWEGHSDDSIAMPILLRDKVIEDYNKTHESIFKQSYFELQIPDDVKTQINTQSNSVHELVDKYADQCSLKFISGNFVTEASNISYVKDALKRYIESGFTRYCVDNYRDILNKYRDDELRDYMHNLIAEYGNDYKVVGEHVRHPSLTHELLGNYSKQLKGLDLTHEEQIVEATRLYINDLTNKGETLPVKETVVTEKPIADKDLFQEQLEQSVDFDEEGNVIFYDDEEDTSYNMFSYEDFESDDVITRLEAKPYLVWELGDNITFDVQDISTENINKILSYVYEHSESDGFFKIYLIYGGKLVDTGLRVENLDVEEANNILINLQKPALEAAYV